MEAIVGLGIIEAFSYVLLYYTFIHSLNRTKYFILPQVWQW